MLESNNIITYELLGESINEQNHYKIIIKNYDKFLVHFYNYYFRKGFYCILIENFVNLFILGFIIFFITFLSSFIDYNILFENYNLYQSIDININKLSYPILIFIFFSSILLFRQIYILIQEGYIYYKIKKFYNNQLNIGDTKIETIPWFNIINKLCDLNNIHNIKPSPFEITNRIMRKENYFIALINKNIIDFNFNIPFYGKYNYFTQILEWALHITIIDFLFDKSNNVRIDFLRNDLIDKLSTSLTFRFRFIGIISLIFLPFILFLLLAYYVFKYGQEYKSNTFFNSRQWSLYSKWKFREFNELNHIFQNRINNAHKLAIDYVDQFPSYKLSHFSRLIEFISSAILIVIIIITIDKPEILTKLYIYDTKTALWLVGILGTIISISRSFIPNENFIFNPEDIMIKISKYTHYMPKNWRYNCHTEFVSNSFKHFFNFKIIYFINELVGIIIIPFILICKLPYYSYDIVSFINSHTSDISEVGYVCSFATFDFKRNGNPEYGITENNNMVSYDGKMENSYINFSENYNDIDNNINVINSELFNTIHENTNNNINTIKDFKNHINKVNSLKYNNNLDNDFENGIQLKELYNTI